MKKPLRIALVAMALAAGAYKAWATTTTVANVVNADAVIAPARFQPDRKLLSIYNSDAGLNVKLALGGTIATSDVTQVQKFSLSNIPTAGSLGLSWNGNNSAAILPTNNAAAIQATLRSVSGLGSVTVTGSGTAGFSVTMTGVTPQVLATDPQLTINYDTLNIAQVTEVQTIGFSTSPTAGSFGIGFNGGVTSSLGTTATSSTVQTAVRTLPGLGSATVSGDFAGGFVVTMTGTSGPQNLMTIPTNSLVNGTTAVSVTVTESTLGVAFQSTSVTPSITTPGAYANGIPLAPLATLKFDASGVPQDAVHALGTSATAARLIILESF